MIVLGDSSSEMSDAFRWQCHRVSKVSLSIVETIYKGKIRPSARRMLNASNPEKCDAFQANDRVPDR